MVLGGLALLVGILILALRNEEQLAAAWARLLGPSGARLRRTLDAQLTAEENLEALRRRKREEASRAGQVLEAAHLSSPEDPEKRERRRALLDIRRMLGARKRS